MNHLDCYMNQESNLSENTSQAQPFCLDDFLDGGRSRDSSTTSASAENMAF